MKRVRHDKRLRFIVLGVFVAVGLFAFLVAKNNQKVVDAADLSKFEPGNIISDYTMSNYNSMTEAEIQDFLTKRNSCQNTDYEYYKKLTSLNGEIWHWNNSHFVCISEEKFGDGEIIGEGETAAHIIYEIAQSQKINPQALLVLLEKETGLISDPIPNIYDYRKAVGYGCYDSETTCRSEFYGFKNQLTRAAKLFREVLDGGWTNYPIGSNYVQYNPDSSCGGTVINIQNLATSSLYRYTPYQPNSASLAAGYGQGDYCSSYGNRNFYQLFYDWFGDPTKLEPLLTETYNNMVTPRLLYVNEGSRFIDPETGIVNIRSLSSLEFFTHLNYQNGNLCLAIGEGRNCYLYTDLKELELTSSEDLTTPRMLIAKQDAHAINIADLTFEKDIVKGEKIIFSKKTYIDGSLCLITQEINNRCVFYSDLIELPQTTYEKMSISREIYVRPNSQYIDTQTGITEPFSGNQIINFANKTTFFGNLCLQPAEKNNTNQCIMYDDLIEVSPIQTMAVPRFLKINTKDQDTIVLNSTLNDNYLSSYADKALYFTDRIYINGELCLISNNTLNGGCIMYNSLSEIPGYDKMVQPRVLSTNKEIYYHALDNSNDANEPLKKNQKMNFNEKIIINGELCLISQQDTKQDIFRCVWYSDLDE